MEFTTPEPLKPELYSYTFLVDGLKINDPANVYMIRDVASVTNVFIIGGDERIDLYKVNKVPHGTVSKVWYNSPTLGMDRRLTVYTPAGYETSGKRYPRLLPATRHGWRRERMERTGTYGTDSG